MVSVSYLSLSQNFQIIKERKNAVLLPIHKRTDLLLSFFVCAAAAAAGVTAVQCACIVYTSILLPFLFHFLIYSWAEVLEIRAANTKLAKKN